MTGSGKDTPCRSARREREGTVDKIAPIPEGCRRAEISRRELLQTFGLTAGAAFALTAVPRPVAAFAQAAKRRTFPLATVQHISYAVADYPKSRDFYVDLFGMRVTWDDGKGCAVEYGTEKEVYGMYIRPVSKPGDKAVVNHVAWGVPNFVQYRMDMKAEIDRRGLQNVRPDGEHGWICDDPSGYMLNIVASERDKAMYPGAANPCEVADSAKCREGWEAGRKNLASATKPSGKGFKAKACSLVFNVTDVAKETEFYREMFGVTVVSSGAQESVMKFGPNTLTVRKTSNPNGKGSCDHFAFVIENYDAAKAEAELKRRGLNPKAGANGFTFADPDGFSIGIVKA